MANKNELQVAITGESSSATKALGAFAEAAKTTAEKVTEHFGGMTGELAKLALGFGSLASLGSLAMGKAVEGLKAIIEYIPESIEATHKLVENFEGLHVTADMSVEDFNKWNAVMELSNSSADSLNDIVRGMERGIKMHSASLVANGVFASEAALHHATLAEYIGAVVKKMEEYGDATDRDQLLLDAFGRGGMQFAATLVKINENMKEGLELGEKQGVLTQKAIADQNELERVKGRVALEQKVLQSLTSDATIQMDIALQKSKAEALRAAAEGIALNQAIASGLVQVRTRTVEYEDEQHQLATQTIVDLAATKKAYQEILEQQTSLISHEAKMESMRERRELVAKAAQEHTKLPDDFYDPKKAEKEAAAKREGEARAKEAKAVLNTLQEEGHRLAAEDLKTLEATTIEEKKRQAVLEAGARLQAAIRKINTEVDKSPGAKNQAEGEKDRLAAFKLYDDEVAKIERESAAKSVEEAKKAAEEKVAAVKKAHEELKKSLAELSLINGPLGRGEIGTQLDSFGAKGSAEAQAVKQYKLEVHWDETAAQGAQAGLKQFVAQADNEWGVWHAFTLQSLNGAQNGFDRFLISLVDKHTTATEKLKALSADLARTTLQGLAQVASRQLVNWGIEKTISAWKKTDNVVTTASTAAAAAAKGAIDVTAATTSVASSEVQTAAAESTMAAKIYAWYSTMGPWAIPAAAATIAAVIAAINGIGKITAHATGGIIDRPTLALMGEAGAEVVAPEHDFLHWANELGSAHYNLGANIGAQHGQAQRLQVQAGSYAGAAAAQVRSGNAGGGSVDLRGAIIAGSGVESSRIIGNLVKQHLDDYNRRKG